MPLSGGALNGVDALYATVQMPKGIPVATVAIDGSLNAALLVVEMLAISDADLAAKLADDRRARAGALRRGGRASRAPGGQRSERDALAGAAEVLVEPAQRVLLADPTARRR